MLSATIKSRIKQDLLNYHLSQYGYAELVTYVVNGGDSCSQFYVHVEENIRLEVDDMTTLTEVEEIEVLASRDPAATDSNGVLIGGICRPYIGDKLLRSEAFDPEQRWYTFAGELPEANDIKVRMKFIRNKRRSQGTGTGR